MSLCLRFSTTALNCSHSRLTRAECLLFLSLPCSTDNAIKNRWNSTLYRILKKVAKECERDGIPPPSTVDEKVAVIKQQLALEAADARDLRGSGGGLGGYDDMGEEGYDAYGDVSGMGGGDVSGAGMGGYEGYGAGELGADVMAGDDAAGAAGGASSSSSAAAGMGGLGMPAGTGVGRGRGGGRAGAGGRASAAAQAAAAGVKRPRGRPRKAARGGKRGAAASAAAGGEDDEDDGGDDDVMEGGTGAEFDSILAAGEGGQGGSAAGGDAKLNEIASPPRGAGVALTPSMVAPSGAVTGAVRAFSASDRRPATCDASVSCADRRTVAYAVLLLMARATPPAAPDSTPATAPRPAGRRW